MDINLSNFYLKSKLFLLRKYLALKRPTLIPIKKLIIPHRKDILLRIQFINDCIVGDKDPFSSKYFHFLRKLENHKDFFNKDPKKIISSFFELYESISREGYLPEVYGYIKVQYFYASNRLIFPKDSGFGVSKLKTNKIILTEGAHRIAVLFYLRYKLVKCKLDLKTLGRLSDYSTFLSDQIK